MLTCGRGGVQCVCHAAVFAATVAEYSPPLQPSTYQALRNCSVILSRGVYDILGLSSWYHSHQKAPAHQD